MQIYMEILQLSSIELINFYYIILKIFDCSIILLSVWIVGILILNFQKNY